MRYRAQQKIHNTLFDDCEHLNEEDFIRDFCCKFVRDLPIERVLESFNVKIYKADSNTIREAYRNKNEQLVEKLQELEKEETILFEAKI